MSTALFSLALAAKAQLTNYTQGFEDVPGIFATGGWVFDGESARATGEFSHRSRFIAIQKNRFEPT
jgi:hypothetical protein